MWSKHIEGILRVPEVDSCMVHWTCQVQLIEASHVKTTCGSDLPKKFRYFVFCDFQGVKVTALAIDGNIDCVSQLLVPFRKYRISKARVYKIPDCVTIGFYPYYWVLTDETVLDEVFEIEAPKLPCYFPLASISSCHTVAETEKFINIMGIVLCAFPAREVYFEGEPSVARDYVIVNNDMKPIILTLWNEFEALEGTAILANIAENPVVICIRVRVIADSYLSLSTQSSSVILVSPNVQQAGNLRILFQAKSPQLIQMLHQRSYANPCVLLPPVASNHDIGTAWIKGKVSLEYRMGNLWYLACPHCYLPNDFALNWGIMCCYCGQEIYTYPRACVILVITDETGSLNAIAMGDEAEKLIVISIHRLFQAEQENVHLTDRVANELEGKVLLCYVKHSNDVIKTVKGAPYTIVAVYGADEIGSNIC